MSERFFAPCPRGLEAVLAAELGALGATQVETADGGVGFTGDVALCMRVNLESRIASRVLWRVGHAGYRNERDVHAAARALDWPRWFTVDKTIRVNVSAIRSPLKSLDFATLTIKDALCDRFRDTCGKRPSVDTQQPDVRIHAFLTATDVTFYLDTSGEPLFKRGYRREGGEAPLRENLAAGILRLTGWQPGTPLLDPMCGSGTFLAEAAMIASDIPPGHARGFGFEKLAAFDWAVWTRMRETAQERRRVPAAGTLHGTDLKGDMLKLAHANLDALGVADAVSLKQVNVLELSPPAPAGILVANPPYGVRMEDAEQLAAFYPKLGDALKQRFAGWTAYLFSGDTRLPKLIGLKPSRRTPLFNGALECRLYEIRVISGSARRPSQGSGPHQ
jgi:putative N6-adenine-specific DNA methylase